MLPQKTAMAGSGVYSCHSICWYSYQLLRLQSQFAWWKMIWLVVEPTHLKTYARQIGSFPQVEVNIKNNWNHHLEILDYLLLSKTGHSLVSTWNLELMCSIFGGVNRTDLLQKLFPFQSIQMGQQRNSMHNCLHLDIALCNNIQYIFSACVDMVLNFHPTKKRLLGLSSVLLPMRCMFLSQPKESTKLEHGNFGGGSLHRIRIPSSWIMKPSHLDTQNFGFLRVK